MAKPVLLYDGDCGLCNRLVRLLLRSDRAGRLHYAPLQGAAAQGYLRAQGLPTEDFDFLVFIPDWEKPVQGAYLLRTDGALAAAAVVGGWLAYDYLAAGVARRIARFRLPAGGAITVCAVRSVPANPVAGSDVGAAVLVGPIRPMGPIGQNEKGRTKRPA